MLRYFPIFIAVFFLALISCVMASQAVVHGVLRDMEPAETAAPAYFANLVMAVLLVLTNLMVIKGFPLGAIFLRALMGAAFAVAFASWFAQAPFELVTLGVAAAVSGLVLTMTQRYTEMVEHFLHIRQNY